MSLVVLCPGRRRFLITGERPKLAPDSCTSNTASLLVRNRAVAASAREEFHPRVGLPLVQLETQRKLAVVRNQLGPDLRSMAGVPRSVG